MTVSSPTGKDHAYAIDICVCTYKRPELEATLRSLAAQNLPIACSVRVIVADNDTEPSAQALVARVAEELPFPVTYVHSPAANISIARNACLDAATGDYAAFIDDDEVASVNWLSELVAVADKTAADAVLGPVKASYAAEAPSWMAHGDFHSTLPVWVQGEIRTGYTCNTLLRRSSPHVAQRRFDLSLGRSGGEDTAFFTQVYQSGGRIAFAPEAWVHEDVPVARAKAQWLLKRRYRVGQTHGRIVAQDKKWLPRTGQIALAASKAAYSFASALPFIMSPARRNRALLRGVMHVGALSGLLGVREIVQYGEQTELVAKGGASHGT
jgi:succinoglycan biosynthesis protein ExoM